MIFVTLAVFVLFVWLQITARAELPLVDSGPYFVITAIMVLTLFILSSFSSLTVTLDENHLRVKFGYGIFHKKFAVSEIVSVERVKNHWYYGWGIHLWLWPYMWIYNVSGFDAVQIVMKNGKIYRIGTDVPKELEMVIKNMLK